MGESQTDTPGYKPRRWLPPNICPACKYYYHTIATIMGPSWMDDSLTHKPHVTIAIEYNLSVSPNYIAHGRSAMEANEANASLLKRQV